MAAFSANRHYIPTKNYRQITIEISFVNLKQEKKRLIFIDLLDLLELPWTLDPKETFDRQIVLFCSKNF